MLSWRCTVKFKFSVATEVSLKYYTRVEQTVKLLWDQIITYIFHSMKPACDIRVPDAPLIYIPF